MDKLSQPRQLTSLGVCQLFTLCLAVAALLSGCGSLIPHETKRDEATKTAGQIANKQTGNLDRQAQVTPPITVSKVGEGATVNVTVPAVPQSVKVETNGEIRSESNATDTAKESVSIPLFVKIIGLAVGVFALFGAVFWAIKAIKNGAAGAATAAALDLGDSVLAKSIQKMRLIQAGTTDVNTKQVISDHIAAMESERGKMAKGDK